MIQNQKDQKTGLKNRIKIKISYLLLVSLFFIQSCEKKTAENHLKYNRQGEITKLITKANLHYITAMDSAYIYYNKAILLCEPKVTYAEDYVYSLTNIANLQQNSSDYYGSEENLTKTLPYLKYTKKPKFAQNVYTLIAYNYYYSFDYNSAIIYHIKALKLAKTPFRKSEILNDIILIYLTQEKYQEATELLIPLVAKKIKHESDPNETDFNYSLLLDNLGYCYYKLGNPKALDCLNKSLKIKLELKDEYGLIGTYNTLSTYYSKTNAKMSKMYAEKAYESARKTNAGIYKANGLAVLMKKSEGNELKKYTLAFIKLSDSFTIAREKAKNKFARIKYDSKIDKAENLELKAQRIENKLEIEKQKNRTIISYITIISILGSFIFLYFRLTFKRKKETKDVIYQSEMRIAKKLNDQLADNVFETLAFLKDRNFELEENKEELINNLDAIYLKTRDLSKENSTIDTDKNYDFVLKEMVAAFKTQDLNILLNGFDSIQWSKIDKNKKIILYRILQEVFANMKKHSQATLVSLTFKKSEKKLTVIYNDNGAGSGTTSPILKNGLQNVESRIKTINGTITFENNLKKGFKLSFSFPL